MVTMKATKIPCLTAYWLYKSSVNFVTSNMSLCLDLFDHFWYLKGFMAMQCLISEWTLSSLIIIRLLLYKPLNSKHTFPRHNKTTICNHSNVLYITHLLST